MGTKVISEQLEKDGNYIVCKRLVVYADNAEEAKSIISDFFEEKGDINAIS